MAQDLPLYRTSFASLEDDGFFSAYSSQPASRLMSVFVPQEYGQLAEDANSIKRPSEPLISVCIPPAGSMLPCSREESSVPECLADPGNYFPKHHRFNPTSHRRQSNQPRGQKAPDEAGTACCGHLPHLTRAQLNGHISQQEIDDILRSVRCYLSTRQHRDASRKNTMPMSPSQALPESSYFDAQTLASRDDQYLVTADEIVGVLDIVIAGLRKFQDDSIQLEYQSLLFPNSTPVKPTLSPRNIILGASTVVDPATTICLPRPCFSWADSVEAFRYPSPTAESFSDASCQDNTRDDYDNGDILEIESLEPSMYFPRYSSPNRHLSWPEPPMNGPMTSFGTDSSFNAFDSAVNNPRPPEQRSTSEPNSQWLPKNGLIRAAATPMTSFPRLVSRSCTNDWLTPLGLLDETENHERTQHQEAIPDLYHRGVDAHSGVCIHTPLSILEEDPRTTPTCPDCSPFIDDYDRPLQKDRYLWPSQDEEGNSDHRQKLGRSIGAASHRRIKARELHNQQQDLKENLLDGLRRYSFLPLLEQTPETIRRDHPAPPSWMEIPLGGDKERKLSGQQLLQQILGQSDASSVKSSRSKSSSGAPTTTQPKNGSRKLSGIAAGSCSEDTAPHTCLDGQWRGRNFR
ncbi:hypothetical protein F4680DRAFT_464346 [Xylaria scruposa]|nr:hypothetical protein F4680DRAFT_464346 [Xylaria scruposa]